MAEGVAGTQLRVALNNALQPLT